MYTLDAPYIPISVAVERRFAKGKLLLDGLGVLACNQKAFLQY